MNYFLANITLYSILFILCLCVIIGVFVIGFAKLKRESNQHLSLISEDIEVQKELHSKLQERVVASKIKDDQIQRKTEKIRFEIIQIDYSYQEILKYLLDYFHT